MSVRTIRLPDIGEGVTEAEIVEWCVRVGDELAEDQVIGSVLTDKAAVEIPSPEAGIVIALGGEVGDVLAVGAELARIELVETVSESGVQQPDQQGHPPSPTSERDTVNGIQNETGNRTDTGTDDGISADAHAESADTQLPETAIVNDTGQRARAAPAVRQRARKFGMNLDEVPSSGPEGRITHADLDRYLVGSSRIVNSDSGSNEALEEDAVEQFRVIGVRRKIARQMQLAWTHIPHFSYIEEVDVTVLEALRTSLKGSGGAPSRPSPLPFIVRALVLALDSFPRMNAHYDDEAEIIHQHSACHLGIATATANGLIVPVVRHAESLDLRELATEIARVTEAARAGRVSREELSGGTITVTSLGALGGLASTPIINHPQVAIVAVNRIVKRPMCRDGLVELRYMMNLSASFDHRVLDGQDAAQFVQQIRDTLERPGTLLFPD